MREYQSGHWEWNHSLVLLSLAVIVATQLTVLVVFALEMTDKISTGLAVLLHGVLWGGVIVQVASQYPGEQTIVLTLMLIILLPATISFYAFGYLLVLFATPIVGAVLFVLITHPHFFNFSQISGAMIILGVIVSARYILLEWYLRTQRSETANRLLINRLIQRAGVDSLTGLYNRSRMDELFRQSSHSLPEGTHLALVLLDIDYFKNFNDTYGHPEGDACLRRVASLLKQVAADSNGSAFRLGGEEFMILARVNDISAAQDISERIQAELRQAAIPHQASMVSQVVTVSQGVAMIRQSESLPSGIARADKAMYRAKKGGRNGFSLAP
ncbi:hypothetical protein TUM12370_29490 [Salmonella enterica subsp. enterica serovar Choleraesuis]|nr:hypothetical protein TUM12370_29490 [Salmonella enterica subsp. enterica serovar Choleraesuis]